MLFDCLGGAELLPPAIEWVQEQIILNTRRLSDQCMWYPADPWCNEV